MTTYLKGYTVKPFIITNSGSVIFTDGTNQLIPNQQQCEAYGYTYDKSTGTCVAFVNSSLLQKTLRFPVFKISSTPSADLSFKRT